MTDTEKLYSEPTNIERSEGFFQISHIYTSFLEELQILQFFIKNYARRARRVALAAALGAASVNAEAHMVVYFEQRGFADLLHAHCPHAECNVSLSIELMVRSAQDPGSSRVQRQLLSTLEGPTQFSLTVPNDIGESRYGPLFAALKTEHDVTLFGMAETALGDDLILNAPSDQKINPGAILYFMSAQRIEPGDIDWSELST